MNNYITDVLTARMFKELEEKDTKEISKAYVTLDWGIACGSDMVRAHEVKKLADDRSDERKKQLKNSLKQSS